MCLVCGVVRCAFGPAETFDVVRLFCSFPMVNFLSTPFIHWSRVSIFSSLLLPPNMLLIFFPSFFLLFVASCVEFHCPHGSRRSFVLFFFPYIYSRCCTFAPHKANKFIYPSLPNFFVYLFCLPENLLGLSARQKQRRSMSHTKSQILSHLPVCAS